MLKNGLLLLAGTLAVTGSLLATPTLKINVYNSSNVLTGSKTVTDELAGDGDLGTIGSVISSGPAIGTAGPAGTNGQFKVTATGLTKPSVPTNYNLPGVAELDLTAITASGQGKMVLMFTENDFTTPDTFLSLFGKLTGQLTSSTTNNSTKVYATFEVYKGANGTPFDIAPANKINPGTSLTGLGPSGTGTEVFGTTYSVSPYSLTLVATLVHVGNQSSQLQSNFSQVPEPGFYGALAVGLSGLLVFAKRRQKRA